MIKGYRRIIFFCFFCTTLILSNSTLWGQSRPNQISGLKLWLKADSLVTTNGNNVSQWGDCSGHSHNCQQTNSSLCPILQTNQLNNLPGIKFNGSNAYLLGDVINGLDTSSATLIILASGEAMSADIFRGIFAIDNLQFGIIYDGYLQNISFIGGGGYTWQSGAPLPSSGFSPTVMMVKKKKGDKIEQFLNNTLNFTSQNSIFNGSFTNNNYQVGRTNGSWSGYYNGNLYEIILFDRYLTSQESNNIFNYLASKYGGNPVSLGQDIHKTDFCPQVLSAGDGYVSYLWNTGAITKDITVNHSGTYSVAATNSLGFISRDTIVVTYPTFSLHDTLMCKGNNISLSSGLDGTYSFLWSNGNTTNSISISDSGDFWVSATKNTCTKNSDTIRVSVDYFTELVSLGNDTVLCSGNPIGLAFPDPSTNGLQYMWSTGSDSTNIVVNSSGNYSVSVTDDHGCVGRDTVFVQIGGTAPAVDFSFSQACVGDTVSFTNNSVPVGTSWTWNFGDSQTSHQSNINHVFSGSGHYNVTLTVYDGTCENSLIKDIFIVQKPTVSFNASDKCVGVPHLFSDLSSAAAEDTISSWLWDFGDGSNTSTLQNPVHTFTQNGSYNMSLIITTQMGCVNSYTDTIHIVNTGLLPDPFSLISPPNLSNCASASVPCSWNNSQHAHSYSLEYSHDSTFVNGVNKINNIASTHFDLVVPMNGKIFWRVVAFGTCEDSVFSNTYSFIRLTPNQISGLKLWLKADSLVTTSGSNVSQWGDCSGHLHHCFQNNNTLRPEFLTNQLNHMPCVRFNGSNSYLSGDVINGLDTSSATLIVLASGGTMSGDVFRGLVAIDNLQFGLAYDGMLQNITSLGGGGYTWQAGAPLPNSGFLPSILMTKKMKGVKVEQFINSTLNHTNTSPIIIGSFTNNNYQVGRTNGSYSGYYNGNIYEVLLYDKFLNEDEYSAIENYLRSKYAPSVNLGKDIVLDYGMCPVLLDAGNGFESYLWSTGETAQTINVSESGQYSIIATNIFGDLSFDTINVLMPEIRTTDTTFCIGSGVTLAANPDGDYEYLWLPDSTNQNSIIISEPDVYSLVVKDTSGCYRMKSFTVVADSFAIKASLGPDRKVCNQDYIGLISGSNQASQYLWSDGSSNSLLIINDPLWSQTQYSVTVTSNNGCVLQDTILVKVNGLKPVANFVSDSACQGSVFHFNNTSTMGAPFSITNYNWDFADGQSSADLSPNHIFANDGYYNVKLTVTSDSGCVSSIEKTVVSFSYPQGNFLPVVGCRGVPLSFIDKSLCNIGNINYWHWNFNDSYTPGEDTSSQQNPFYAYDSAGNFVVSLITSTDKGCADTTTKNIIIKPAPALDFTASPACEAKSVYFNDIITTETWNQILNYKWIFGDGDSSAASNPVHTYYNAGLYPVSFSVVASNGCHVSKCDTVKVESIPSAYFDFHKPCTENLTQFIDETQMNVGSVNQWKWMSGNSVFSTQQNPVYMFPDTGIHWVRLVVASENHCKDSITLQVKIYPGPHADFIITPEYGIPPLNAGFTNLSSGASQYVWQFGDGENSTDFSPDHTYYTAGVYPVILYVSNDFGCNDSLLKNIFVIPTTTDITVKGLNIVVNNGRVYVSAQIVNNGTRKIEEMDLSVDFGNGNRLHEMWNGSLDIGDEMNYPFSVSSEISAEHDVPYICVAAELPGLTDENIEDNRKCEALSEEFLLLNAYPNPASDKVMIPALLPYSGDVTLSVVNELGCPVYNSTEENLDEGYQIFSFDVSELSKGIYTINVTYRDKILSKKFMKK